VKIVYGELSLLRGNGINLVACWGFLPQEPSLLKDVIDSLQSSYTVFIDFNVNRYQILP
jgi:hypothetical protein